MQVRFTAYNLTWNLGLVRILSPYTENKNGMGTMARATKANRLEIVSKCMFLYSKVQVSPVAPS